MEHLLLIDLLVFCASFVTGLNSKVIDANLDQKMVWKTLNMEIIYFILYIRDTYQMFPKVKD